MSTHFESEAYFNSEVAKLKEKMPEGSTYVGGGSDGVGQVGITYLDPDGNVHNINNKE